MDPVDDFRGGHQSERYVGLSRGNFPARLNFLNRIIANRSGMDDDGCWMRFYPLLHLCEQIGGRTVQGALAVGPAAKLSFGASHEVNGPVRHQLFGQPRTGLTT